MLRNIPNGKLGHGVVLQICELYTSFMPQFTENCLNQSGFTRAILTYDNGQFAAMDMEIDILDDDLISVPNSDITYLNAMKSAGPFLPLRSTLIGFLYSYSSHFNLFPPEPSPSMNVHTPDRINIDEAEPRVLLILVIEC